MSNWRNNVDAIIKDKLYLGNLVAAKTPQCLFERKITHILTVCNEPIPAHHPNSGYVVKVIRDVDDDSMANLLIHLPSACDFIDHAMRDPKAVILVHCVQGISRSACVVAAWIMRSRRVPAPQAMEIVRQARQQIWLNPGFQEQLTLFELCQYYPEGNSIYLKWRATIQGRRPNGGR